MSAFFSSSRMMSQELSITISRWVFGPQELSLTISRQVFGSWTSPFPSIGVLGFTLLGFCQKSRLGWTTSVNLVTQMDLYTLTNKVWIFYRKGNKIFEERKVFCGPSLLQCFMAKLMESLELSYTSLATRSLDLN